MEPSAPAGRRVHQLEDIAQTPAEAAAMPCPGSLGRWRRPHAVGWALLAGFICIVFAVSADLAIAHRQLMAIST